MNYQHCLLLQSSKINLGNVLIQKARLTQQQCFVSTLTTSYRVQKPVQQNFETDKKFRNERMFHSEEESEKKNTPLYTDHIPTNYFQKSLLSVGAATAALLNPRRHDMVAVLGETTGFSSLRNIYTKMLQDSEGQQILADKPRINTNTVNLKTLSELPPGTLGNCYIKFLTENNVTPDSRLPVQFIDDIELAYVMQRYREAHDLFHTVLGMPTNMLGEVTVKWVEAFQTGLPMCIGGALFGPIRLKTIHRQKYVKIYLPWAVQVGKNSKLLMNMYFEKRWDQSIDDIRDEFNIEPPPS